MVPFSMTLNAPNQDFKFPPLFDANISDTVRDTGIITMEYMHALYSKVLFRMTLGDRE